MFKERFIQIIQSKNLTAYKVAKATGISQGLMNEYKNGIKLPTLQNLLKIADYLDCSVDYLLGRTDCPEVARSNQSDTPSSLHIAAKGRGAHVIDMDPEQLKALKKALADLPDDV